MTSSETPGAGLGTDEKRALAEELAVSVEQIDEAERAVGSGRSDIELYLKGSRSTTTADKMSDAGGG